MKLIKVGRMKLVMRVDTRHLEETQRAEIREWVTGFGVDPTVVLTTFAITIDKGEPPQYTLHLSVILPDDDGKPMIDVVREEIVTRPARLPIGPPDTWPPIVRLLDRFGTLPPPDSR